MKLLFLLSRLAGYMHGCIEGFVNAFPEAQATILAQPNTPEAPFAFPPHPQITIRDYTTYVAADWDRVVDSRPDVAVMGGWFIPPFRRVGRRLRNRIPVVMAMDNLWKGTVRQRIMTNCLAPWVHSFCNHIWIPGLYQYEYARRLRFPRDAILTGVYSANNALYSHSRATPGQTSPKTITFIGNMWQDKGVNELVEAFSGLAPRHPEWRLQLIGGGPLVDRYRNTHERIDVTGFCQQPELPGLLGKATVFCLPSYHDQWGVVIHEACCAGLPVIATDVCGAVSAFVQHGYNGFRCKPRDVGSLTRALDAMMKLPDATLAEFGRRSHELSQQITRELWASRLAWLLEQRTSRK